VLLSELLLRVHVVRRHDRQSTFAHSIVAASWHKQEKKHKKHKKDKKEKRRAEADDDRPRLGAVNQVSLRTLFRCTEIARTAV